MSMSSKVLRCEKCEDTINTVVLYQDLRYRFKNTDVRINKGIGYCHDCESLGIVENFESIDYEIEIIEECSKDAIKRAKRFLWLNLTPRMKNWNAYPTQELTSNAYLLAIALKRKGDERCLNCLSQNIIQFDGDMELEYSIAGCYEGKKRTGFYHPGCGGEYIVYGSDVRFSLVREARYFSLSDDWQISSC